MWLNSLLNQKKLFTNRSQIRSFLSKYEITLLQSNKPTNIETSIRSHKTIKTRSFQNHLYMSQRWLMWDQMFEKHTILGWIMIWCKIKLFISERVEKNRCFLRKCNLLLKNQKMKKFTKSKQFLRCLRKWHKLLNY